MLIFSLIGITDRKIKEKEKKTYFFSEKEVVKAKKKNKKQNLKNETESMVLLQPEACSSISIKAQ